MNIADTLTQGRRDHPDRTAVLFEGQAITYAMLDRAASRVAHTLRRAGIDRGDRVALLLPNVPAFIHAYVGTLKIGAIAVSINTGLSPAEIRFVLDDSGATALITTRALRELMEQAGPPATLRSVLVTDADDDQDSSDETIEAIDLAPETPAAIVYTSGTTGAPKGAVLSHANVRFVMAAKQRYLGIQPDDRLLLFLPLYHCFGQNAILNAALYAGATVVLQRSFDPAQVLDSCRREGATMLFGVPATFIVLMDRADASASALGSLRYCFSAAAPLPVHVETAWQQKFGLPIHQGYGLTETSPFASYNHLDRHRPRSIGVAIEDVDMRVVDVTTGEPVATGERGEIVIRGANVMLGYWQRPAETAEVIRDGWFHSGDIGRLDADGYFFIEDRLKDLIIVGGSNVYPAEVERVLHQHPAVADAAVYGVPDAVLGEQVRAAIVVATGAFLTAADLLTWCRGRIAAFKAPGGIDVVTEIPRNRTGKILKRVLRDQYAAAQATAALLRARTTTLAASGAPVTGTETLGNAAAQATAADAMATGAVTPAAVVLGAAAPADGALGAAAPDANAVERWIAAWLADVLALAASPSVASGAAREGVDFDRPLSDYGVTSLIAVDLAAALAAWLDRPVTPTLAWHHPTIRAIAAHLGTSRAPEPEAALGAEATPVADLAALTAMSEAAAEAALIETLARLRG